MDDHHGSMIELWIRVDNGWKAILSIPVDELSRLSYHPLKWLRFVGYTIYGSEGHLSTVKDPGPPVDYTVTSERLSEKYYYLALDPPLFLDAQGIDDRTTDLDAESTTSRTAFRDALVARDQRCIVTDVEPIECTPCHILPHSKGDQYVRNFSSYRGDSENYINDISDPNGFLLCTALHRSFGAGEIAFLNTPNFALAEDDIPLSSENNQGHGVSNGRLTLQHLVQPTSLVTRLTSHNQDARQPVDTSEWPPATVTDFWYGCAVLRAWGVEESVSSLDHVAGAVYYGHGVESGKDLEDDSVGGYQPTLGTIRGNTIMSGADRYKKRREQGLGMGRVMAVVNCLWMKSAKRRRMYQASKRRLSSESAGLVANGRWE